MATKSFDSCVNLVVDVIMKNGKTFNNCDVPPDPQALDGCLAFWVGEELLTIPVENIELYKFKKEESK